MLGFLEGADLWIVLAVVALLFGGTQIPKLARSLGSASHEFKKGIDEGASAAAKGDDKADPGDTKADPGDTKADEKASDSASKSGSVAEESANKES